MKNKCCIEGCKRIIGVKKHKLCWSHARRMYRTGDVGTVKIRKRTDYKPYFGEVK